MRWVRKQWENRSMWNELKAAGGGGDCQEIKVNVMCISAHLVRRGADSLALEDIVSPQITKGRLTVQYNKDNVRRLTAHYKRAGPLSWELLSWNTLDHVQAPPDCLGHILQKVGLMSDSVDYDHNNDLSLTWSLTSSPHIYGIVAGLTCEHLRRVKSQTPSQCLKLR